MILTNVFPFDESRTDFSQNGQSCGPAWHQFQGPLPDFARWAPPSAWVPARAAGPDGTVVDNPDARIVLSAAPGGKPAPVGLVSARYRPVSHGELMETVATRLAKAGVDLTGAEVLAETSRRGERMVAQLVIADPGWSFSPDGYPVQLTAFLWNSIAGERSLELALGWLRLICSNGLRVGQATVRYRSPHNQRLDLDEVSRQLDGELSAAKSRWKTMDRLSAQPVDQGRLQPWVDGPVAESWGRTAAVRLWSILQQGLDSRPAPKGDPNVPPSRRTTLPGRPVPGSIAPAENFYAVFQALSWIASRTQSPELRFRRTAEAEGLLNRLSPARRSSD